MSGYRHGHRSSDREIDRHGRDERERSPARRDRSGRERRYEEDAHGGRYGHPQERYGGRHEGQRSTLPTTVPVPTGGRELVVKPPPMSGTAGIQVLLNVNFFEIQSLPIRKTFSYDVSSPNHGFAWQKC